MVDDNPKMFRRIFDAQYPSCQSVCDRFPRTTEHLAEELKPSATGLNSDTYMRLVSGGYCTVCGIWAGGPPVSSNLAYRLCGQHRCRRQLCTANYTREYRCISAKTDFRLKPKPPGAAKHFLPIEASDWIPYLDDLDIRGHQLRVLGNGRYPLRDLEKTWEDLRFFVPAHLRYSRWSIMDITSPKGHQVVQKYREQAKRYHALESIYKSLAESRMADTKLRKCIKKSNLAKLREVALEREVPLEKLQDDPLVQRILAAHLHDLAHVYLATFRDLQLPGQQPVKTHSPQSSDAEAVSETSK
ncbi:hypothetical protein BD626DRAFT_513028 [Schizophyllum amplum]|uniref:Uncharacterized protein n=1 Tax=Schizophyllum amplum TaxID=97359 RepID=A0A550BZS6_9AGAR|nr:hypothetical protein BD626DRAFT_513028 [Auriculariopsis ampla]